MTFGERLQRLRWQRGWTQVQLAARTELSYKHVAEHENNHYKPSLNTLVRYAKAFDISLSELLKGVDR